MPSFLNSASRSGHLGALRVLVDCSPWTGATIKQAAVDDLHYTAADQMLNNTTRSVLSYSNF